MCILRVVRRPITSQGHKEHGASHTGKLGSSKQQTQHYFPLFAFKIRLLNMPTTFEDLIQLMEKLRSPGGCPWDREQNYATLAPMLLEEAYEAFEAVEEAREGNPGELRDELGDLLFQIVFYAQVAKEQDEFTIEDVIHAIHSKMVRRHPHVFGDVSAEDSATVLRNWEAMKKEERRNAGTRHESHSLLDGVSSKAPALMEAHQLSTKAARVGFDWKAVEDIFVKLEEEIGELRKAIRDHASSNQEAEHSLVREELGDVLFAVTNIARHLKVEPESALKLTNRKFRKRFGFIEDQMQQQQKTFDQMSLDQLEELWQHAKRE